MSNVIHFQAPEEGTVSEVSVQVSEYSEENGGSDVGSGTIYLVETLFTDGKWACDGHSRDLSEANDLAKKVAQDRGAVLLPESIWPNRKVS